MALPRGIATLSDAELGRSLAEPHLLGSAAGTGMETTLRQRASNPAPLVMTAHMLYGNHVMLAFAISHKMRQTSIVLTGLIVFLLPILVGISGVLLPAAGYFPALGLPSFRFIRPCLLSRRPALASQSGWR